ncbi:hypothetical protein C484_03880 [Natrialba taiwanensis DSM 12281]|uniref:Halobacterial output domain-containing protein n=2 Tax=Natrialba taiwanensis TaxID=160846 RepID=M0AC03_9EURY|nr:HalOD1 output domain-containing protein [Natrialba taiwanensis]ELY95397.1 hypothetical protein C484_03880 [Natrialba taiwanensis DSM 12281]
MALVPMIEIIGSPRSSDEILTRRTLDTEQDAPATQIVEAIAELENTGPTELPPIYNCIDDLIANLFSSPPPGEADANITFTYRGYRIHVQQNGRMTILQSTS